MEAKRLAVFTYIKEEDGSPRNDGNPLMKARWLDHCEEHVGNKEDALLTLVAQGVMLTREGTIVSNLEHASDLINGYYQPRSWRDPALSGGAYTPWLHPGTFTLPYLDSFYVL